MNNTSHTKRLIGPTGYLVSSSSGYICSYKRRRKRCSFCSITLVPATMPTRLFLNKQTQREDSIKFQQHVKTYKTIYIIIMGFNFSKLLLLLYSGYYSTNQMTHATIHNYALHWCLSTQAGKKNYHTHNNQVKK